MTYRSYQLPFLLILAGILTLAVSIAARQQEFSEEILPINIEKNSTQDFLPDYVLTRNEACLLFLKTKLENNPEGKTVWFDISTKGHELNSPEVKAELSFNQFDQLFGSLLTFPNLSTQGQLTVGSTGVNPIEIVIKGVLFARPVLLRFSVEGPIRLVEEKNFYRILIPKRKNINQRQNIDISVSEFKLMPYNRNIECRQPDTSQPIMNDAIKMLNQLKNYSQ